MSKSSSQIDTADGEKWLLLIFQLPSKPAYLRVKIWRRLQGIGAVAVKSSVYALPATKETQEDFEWLLREIQQGDGDGMICEARFVDGLSDADVRQLFNQARDTDYAGLTQEARQRSDAMIGEDGLPAEDAPARIARLRKRLTQIRAIDFFGAGGLEPANGLLSALERQLKEAAVQPGDVQSATESAAIPQGSVWVTREDVHVDRIASAWLIRRFIDPSMQLKFVAAKGYIPEAGELRFDMFDAEYTHEGDNCTFEVLLTRAGLHDPALHAIAEIVHDIDIKDNKYGREEVAGVRTLIAGICLTASSDQERIERGAAVFSDLYQFFIRNCAR